MRARAPLALVATLAGALALASCSGASDDGTGFDAGAGDGDSDKVVTPSESEARALVQAQLDRTGACTPFFAMPRDVNADSPFEQKRMDAFAAAGLVRREGEATVADPNSGSGSRSVVRYAVTPEGAKYIRAGAGGVADYKSVICYGRYEVESVTVGQVDEMDRDANIKYRFRLVEPAAWLDVPAIQATYPNFAEWRAARQAEEQDETLQLRDGKWTVDDDAGPDLFDIRQLSH